MKPEQRMWGYLSGKMHGMWDAQRHEDRYSEDIPDVSFALTVGNRGIVGVDGWIELKTIPAWPASLKTMVNIPHLTSGQVNWMERRGSAGTGSVFMLLAVGVIGHADWALIPYTRVRDVYERKLNKTGLIWASAGWWPSQVGLQADGLRNVLLGMEAGKHV